MLARVTGFVLLLLLLGRGASATLIAAPEAGQADASPKTRPARPASGQAIAAFAELDRAVLATADLVDAGAATVAVNIDGKLVYSRGFGWRDKDRQVPVSPDALMRIASVSKPITAAIVKDLVRQKKLSLKTQVFPYLNLTPPPGATPDPRLNEISVQHLLRHEGGWDRGGLGGFDPVFRVKDVEKTLDLKEPATHTDVIRYMLGKPLQFAPGEKSVYSNLGYCVLGRVIEEATDQSYAQVLENTITRPLQIDRLKVGRNSSQLRDPDEVYYPVRDDFFSLDVMDAHGGLIASTPALCRFMQAYWISGEPRPAGAKGQRWVFFGSLPGTTALVLQRTDGIDVAVLMNHRRNAFLQADNSALLKAVDAAIDEYQSQR